MALVLFIVVILILVALGMSFVFVIVRGVKKEMQLCAKLIKQMEATQQAERKCVNKSIAFARASHDIRASLAALTGLIEISYDEVASRSQLEANLKQMEACSKDLLGILNSILDTSKVEAGKMQLEEEKFDVAELVEHVVDLYYPLGLKKGIDVILDPCDYSIVKFSQVKGDRGKLKQILCNLLSNAVKFTSEGHIIVRAWARKPSLKNSTTYSNQNGLLRHLSSKFFSKKSKEQSEAVNNVAQNEPNCLEFVFEVDDTGKGIPKEKQKAVFENYVQVKETALTEGGTGLGLGIVQSLVRLMQGEIGIVDKEMGEKGSCFKFNVLLTMCETSSTDNKREDNIDLTNRTQQDFSIVIENPSPRLGVLSSSPKVEGSYVILLIQNSERRRISLKFMESLGIKVLVIKHWKQLPQTLRKLKHKLMNSTHSSTSFHSSDTSREVPLSTLDGTNHTLSLFKKTNNHQIDSVFLLMVIDISIGLSSELCKIVDEFRIEFQNIACCKIVWLANPMMTSINFRGLEGFDQDDIIKYKPFHGTCMYEIVKILPDFQTHIKLECDKSEQSGRSSNERLYRNIISSHSQYDQSHLTSKTELKRNSVLCREVQKESRNLQRNNNEKPLNGKRILVAEDSAVLRKLAMYSISRLGANVELCENGKEALELVRIGLSNLRKQKGEFEIAPYDYVIMDCEMPIMNGYEATKQIRKEEESYGVHIPIIALTAHTSGEEASNTIKAGMDVHLSKPFKAEHLIEAIRYIHGEQI